MDSCFYLGMQGTWKGEFNSRLGKYVQQEVCFALQSLSALRSHGDDSKTILCPVLFYFTLPSHASHFHLIYFRLSHLISIFSY